MCVGEANLEDVQVCVECLKGGGCRYWKSAYFRKSAWVCDCVVRMWYVFVFLARSFSVTEKKLTLFSASHVLMELRISDKKKSSEKFSTLLVCRSIVL